MSEELIEKGRECYNKQKDITYDTNPASVKNKTKIL